MSNKPPLRLHASALLRIFEQHTDGCGMPKHANLETHVFGVRMIRTPPSKWDALSHKYGTITLHYQWYSLLSFIFKRTFMLFALMKHALWPPMNCHGQFSTWIAKVSFASIGHNQVCLQPGDLLEILKYRSPTRVHARRWVRHPWLRQLEWM
jgi:hypothetical protein